MSPPGLDMFAIFMLICAEHVRSDHPLINQTIVYRLLYVIFQVEGCLLPMGTDLIPFSDITRTYLDPVTNQYDNKVLLSVLGYFIIHYEIL